MVFLAPNKLTKAMKAKFFLITLISFLYAGVSVYGQEKDKNQFVIGLGTTLNSNSSLQGFNLDAEYDIPISKRLSFSPGISFSHSLGRTFKYPEGFPEKNEDYYVSLLINPLLKYDIIKRKSGFVLSFGMGPSYQIGKDSYLYNSNFYGQNEPSLETAKVNRNRVMLRMELEAEWKTKNSKIRNGFALGFTGTHYYYPWLASATYKIKF